MAVAAEEPLRQRWEALARAAVVPKDVIPNDELLLVRDSEGRPFRPGAPPDGVEPRMGAVLMLLYPDGDDLRLPLTVRSDALPTHRGEVSLPGGATDPEDDGPTATALREAQEELGVDPATIEVVGALTPIYIPPSNFQITPVVGFCSVTPAIQLNTDEVSEVISTTLRELLDPSVVVIEQWTLRGVRVQVPFFPIDGYKVWGATALMLSEFVARIRRLLPDETC